MEVLEDNVVRVGPREHDCGPRHVDLTFAIVEDQLQWVGVAVQPIPGVEPEPLEAAELRRCLALGEVIGKAKQELIRRRGLLEAPARRRRGAASKGRSRGRSLDHFVLVAEIYMRAAAEGRNPTQAVAEYFPEVTYSTIAKWVGRCRDPELGLLTPTTKGKPSKKIAPAAIGRIHVWARAEGHKVEGTETERKGAESDED